MVKHPKWAGVAAAALLGAALLAPATPVRAQSLGQQGAEVDRIVAIVNNGVITQRELDHRTQMIQQRIAEQQRLQPQAMQMPPADQLRSEVLNQMVLEELQMQRAREEGLVATDEDIDSTLTRVAASNQMTVDQLKQKVAGEGMSWDDFRDDARRELTLTKLRRNDVDSKIKVSDAEVASYLASQHSDALRNEVRLQHILIPVPANASLEQVNTAQGRANEILEKARSGSNFDKLARGESQAPDAKQNGDLGFKAESDLPKDWVDAVSTLAPGQVAGSVLRDAQGFQVIRLVDRRRVPAPSTQDETQTHVSHILLRVGAGVPEGEVRDKLLDIKKQLDNGGDFATLARNYSQDGSASKGGDLGWISPGETVPDFERAMDRLQPGQVSDAVRTPFGYHLILVQARRTESVSSQQQRESAINAIGTRKSQQAYTDWLRQLRDSAYIQIKNDPLAS